MLVHKLVFCILLFNGLLAYVCPPDWVPWNDNCYYISLRSQQYKDWQQANSICQQLQGDLLYIESQEELDWISTQMNGISEREVISQQWWTGLNDRDSYSNWVWSAGNGTEPSDTFVQWTAGYPKSHDADTCKVKNCNRCSLIATLLDYQPFLKKESSVRGLVEQSCGVKNPYICKRTNISVSPSRCDYADGWRHIDNMCWKLFADAQLPWEQAHRHCEYIENGRLATIHADHQQDALDAISTADFNKFWIGLQINKTGAIITGKWVDGGDLDHQDQPTYWSKGEPDFTRTSRGCVYMDNMKTNNRESWHVASCSEERSYVCQRPEGVCPPDWLIYNGRCYQFRANAKHSWQGAFDHCAAQNTTLMEVKNDIELKVLSSRVMQYAYKEGVDALWLGFKNRKRGGADTTGTNIWWTSQEEVENITVTMPTDVNPDSNQDLCGLVYTDGANGSLALTTNCAQLNAFICEAEAHDSVIAYRPTPRTIHCESDYFQYRGSCYKFNTFQATWFEAQQGCREFDAKLVSIADSQEQAFVNSQASRAYWIGLSSYGKSGRWRWQDGSDISNYQNFIFGYSQKLRTDNNCINLLGTPGRYNGMWNPSDCKTKMHFICEKPGTPEKPAARTTPAADPECGAGWRSSPEDQACYQLNKELRTWSEAEANCIDKGGHLTSVSSGDEQLFVEGLVDRWLSGFSLWIGGNDKNQESSWKWVGGEVFSYTNWDGVTSVDARKMCVAMKIANKRWEIVPCLTKKAYICKKLKPQQVTFVPPQTTPTTTLPVGSTLGCTGDYEMIGEHCYKFYNETSTQLDAASVCSGSGTKLASISSLDQDVNEIQAGWISEGFRNTNIWIGLDDRDGDGQFAWADSSVPVKFVDWATHQPAQLYSDYRCVIMSTEKAQWEVRSCLDEIPGFVCQRRPVPVGVTTSKDDINVFCPQFTTEISDTTCYVVTSSTANFETAKYSCKRHSMDLVYFDSSVEHSRLIANYKRSGTRKVWLNYKNVNGTYTIDGRAVLASEYVGPWSKHHTGNEFDMCVYLDISTGLWNDAACDSLMQGYTCKTYRSDYNPEPKHEVTTCPEKWHYLESHCYQAFYNYQRTAKKTWFQARDTCRLYGGDLLSIHGSMYVNKTYIMQALRQANGNIQGTQYWIGLNNLDEDLSHQWSDGSMFDFSSWYPGEPNNHHQAELCVVAQVSYHFAQRGPAQVTWNDANCYSHFDYICQVPAGTLVATLPPPTTFPTTPSRPTGVPGVCDPGWAEFKGYCYKFKTTSLSWHEAREDCLDKENASLATIHDRQTNDFILSYIVTEYATHWSIGLSRFGKDAWFWEDGTLMNFEFWSEDEPSNHGDAEMCVQIYNHDGFWNDFNCGKTSRGHICMRETGGIQPITTHPPVSGYCKDGFEVHGDRCYGLFGLTAPLNWTDARDTCRSNGIGFDLVSIQNIQENAYVALQHVVANTTGWLGLNELVFKREFYWSDNRPVEYTKWEPDSPGNSAEYRCARMIHSGGFISDWAAVECSVKLPYMCSGPRDPSIGPHTTPLNPNCKGGYEEFEGQCYRVNMDKLTFSDADQACIDDGGRLASIRNYREYLYVSQSISFTGWTDFWLGMKRNTYQIRPAQYEGLYEWVDQMPVTFTKWAYGQPRHIDNSSNCVIVNDITTEWTSTICSDDVKLASICKISNEVPPTHPPTRHICTDTRATGYRDKCYFFNEFSTSNRWTGVKSWTNALKECYKLGMTLASVHDGNVNDFLLEAGQLSGRPHDLWLGLIQKNNGDWTWYDQSALQYENWADDEPTSLGNDVCGALSKQDGTWKASRCYTSMGYVCESDAVSFTLEPITTPTSTPTTTTIATTTEKRYCFGDSKWNFFNESCYYASDTKVSWYAARDACHDLGAQLVSLHGQDEIDAAFRGKYITNYIIAIGLTKMGRSNWGWLDGSLVDYANWWEGEPNNHDGSERCAFMFSHTRYGLYEKGRWNDQHCDAHGAYICKKPEIPKPVTLGPAVVKGKGHCPSDFAEYGNTCYGLFGMAHPLNWTDARDMCRSLGPGGDLVAIHNAKEQAFLTSHLYTLDMNVWIGLSDRFWNNQFWWSNNERVVYTNWLRDQPNIYGTHNCVEMKLHRQYPGRWSDEKCDLVQPYLCSMPKDETIPTTRANPSTELCPKGWTWFDTSCYHVNDKRLNWVDASDWCSDNGASLVSISTPYEQGMVESLTVFHDKPIWIGLAEFVSPLENDTYARFVWRDEYPVTYTNWADNRPVRADTGELKCVAINPATGRWNDTFCYFTYASICKIDMGEPPTVPTVQWGCNDTEQFVVGDRCVWWGGGASKTWSEAHLSCIQEGGKLASVHSNKEHNLIMDKLYNMDQEENVWLGLLRNQDGGFYWVDGTPLGYTNWGRYQPDDDRSVEDCVEMIYTWNGKWNDLPCNQQRHYICDKPAIAMPAGTTPSPNQPGVGSQTSGGSHSGIVATVVVVILLLVAAVAVGGYIVYRKRIQGKSVSFAKFNSRASARFQKGEEHVEIGGPGLSFENSTYEDAQQKDDFSAPMST